MATIATEGSELVVRLNPLEKLGAFHGNVQAPLAAIRSVAVTAHPWREIGGFRAPGTGVPGLIMLGTIRAKGGKEFAAVYVRRSAVLVELDGQPFARLIVCTVDPEADVASLRQHAPAAS